MLSTNTSKEWNLYLLQSNCIATCSSLKMNKGGFSTHQNNFSNFHGHTGYIYSARVSQVNMKTMKKNFEQWS